MDDFSFRIMVAFLAWMVFGTWMGQVGASPIFRIIPAVFSVALLVKPARRLPSDLAALFRVVRSKSGG